MRWLAVACFAWSLAAQQSGQAQFERATTALRQGRLADAESAFQSFLKAHPAHIGALGNLGVVYSRMGLPVKAAAAWERALRSAPGDAALRTNLGLAYMRLEEYGKAKATLAPVSSEQGRELYANALLFSGDPAAAQAILEALPPTSGTLYSLAVARLKQNDRAGASAAFERLVETALTEDQLRFLKGKAYYESGLFEEAQRNLDAITASPPGLALERGKVYLSLRDAARSEAQLRKAVEEAPFDSEANYFLGALLVQQDRANEGKPFLKTALQARPDFWGTHYYLGRAALDARQPAEAIRSLEMAHAGKPGEPAIDFQLSRAYRAAGRPADANAALKRFRSAQTARRESEERALVLR